MDRATAASTVSLISRDLRIMFGDRGKHIQSRFIEQLTPRARERRGRRRVTSVHRCLRSSHSTEARREHIPSGICFASAANHLGRDGCVLRLPLASIGPVVAVIATDLVSCVKCLCTGVSGAKRALCRSSRQVRPTEISSMAIGACAASAVSCRSSVRADPSLVDVVHSVRTTSRRGWRGYMADGAFNEFACVAL